MRLAYAFSHSDKKGTISTKKHGSGKVKVACDSHLCYVKVHTRKQIITFDLFCSHSDNYLSNPEHCFADDVYLLYFACGLIISACCKNFSDTDSYFSHVISIARIRTMIFTYGFVFSHT